MSKVLNQLWRRTFSNKAVLDYMSVEGIKWSFTTALAPWQGGWGVYYDRLVSMVKRCLRKCMGKKPCLLDQLITLMTEIEAVLNSRPLTHVYEDIALDSITFLGYQSEAWSSCGKQNVIEP